VQVSSGNIKTHYVDLFCKTSNKAQSQSKTYIERMGGVCIAGKIVLWCHLVNGTLVQIDVNKKLIVEVRGLTKYWWGWDGMVV